MGDELKNSDDRKVEQEEMSKRRKWVAAVLAALILRAGIGPALIAAQMITGAFEPGGECGNVHFPVPNTDPISWGLSSGATATYEGACAAHDQCYGMLGQSKSTCDWTFWWDMRAGCQETYEALDAPWLTAQVGRFGCRLQAETYFVAVAEPLLTLTYCNEQYYTRVGSRDRTPDPLTSLRECGRNR